MKKYTTIPVSCADLIAEFNVFLTYYKRPDDEVVYIARAGAIAVWERFNGYVPAIRTTFDALGFTAVGAAYRTVLNNTRKDPNVFSISTLIIPVTDIASKIILYQPNDLAQEIPLVNAYSLADCTVIEEIPFTEPLLIGPNVTFNINTLDPNATATFLIFIFDGVAIDSLLAD